MTAPTRLCCGQVHYSPICPDDKVMCCLCFDRFDIEDLNVVNIDFEGQHEDVCKGCAEKEHARSNQGGDKWAGREG